MGRGETYYELLGVARSATPAEIRAAYLELVARYHPDRHADNPLSDLANEKVAELNRAYETLSDPGRRAAYDAALAPGARPGAGRRRSALRLALAALALLLALRVGPALVRAVVRALAALQGTPALLALTVLALVAGIAFFVHRRRRQQRWKRVMRPPR